MTSKRTHMTAAVAKLELRLILRNRAARYLMIASPLLVTALAILMLNFPGPSDVVIESMYLSCMFMPITYGSLAFSWNTTNWACLFQLPVAPRDHLEGRLFVLGCLTVLPVGVLTAFTLWLRPEIASLPVATGLFGVTVISIPLLVVSAKTPKRIDANAPALSDTKKFGWQHWAASLLAVAPAIVLMRLVRLEQFVAVLGVASVLALASLPFALRYASRILASTIPDLSDRLLIR